MHGTIIQLNKSKDFALIHVVESSKLFQAPLSEITQGTHAGDSCEFEVLSEPGMFSHGKAHITKIEPLDLSSNTKVALSYNSTLDHEHELLKDTHEYLIAAEGGFEKECRSALIEKAIECKANALLDLKLECVVRPGVKTVLYRYTARPAIITGPKYQPEPGVERLDIKDNRTRRNSPNEAQVRYIRVLILSFLFIAVPCILSLSKRGVIPSILLGQIITVALLGVSMMLFLFVSFKKRQGYILTLKSIRK